ncbi:MAG: ATP-binding protein [Candidatus Heimdallarchaeota archaeon]
MIIAREITSIPNDILKFNETFAQFCSSKFQGIHYITEVVNQEIKRQFLVGKGKSSDELNASFNGLEKSLGVKLEETNSWSNESNDGYHEGLVVIRGIPPANINVKESNEVSAPMIAFDQVIETSIRSSVNQQFKIISTIEKANLLIGKKKRTADASLTKKILLILRIVFLLVMLGIIGWKIAAYYPSGHRTSSDGGFLDSDILQTIGYLVKDQTFLFVFGFFILYLIFARYYSKYKQKKEINNQSLGEEVSEKKVKTAYENHIEEMQTWGTVRQSFVIIVRNTDRVALISSLDEIKQAIEGVYQGIVFRVEGRVVSDFTNNRSKLINNLLGWSFNNFQGKFQKVKPFKPTVMSIPRSGRNFFRLLSEVKIPGAKITEGLTYKIDTRRTKRGLYLGESFRKLDEETYPLFIKLQDLIRHAFIFGQTGRGKSFFVYNLLSQIQKFYHDIKFLILDPKGEYGRLFGRKEDTKILIAGSEIAPLGINIFKLLEDVEENKRLIRGLLQDYIIGVKGLYADLTPMMEDVIHRAIEKVYLESSDEWYMRTFVQKIQLVLDEMGKKKPGWTEKTRLALNARLRELFTGRFESVFCVKESTLTKELLQSNNVIIQMNKLLLKREDETMVFLANVITAVVANYFEGLFDFESDVPRYIFVIDELQKIAPKRAFERKSVITSYFEIARAHRITMIGLGQNPDIIDKVFQQAGIVVDFGTESKAMDSGERRSLLKVAEFDYSHALNEQELQTLLQNNSAYQQLRTDYEVIPINKTDLEGELGLQLLLKNDVLSFCQTNCDNGHCTGFEFTKHSLPRKKVGELLGLIETDEFINFSYRETENKHDLLCVVIHYLGYLLDKKVVIEKQGGLDVRRGEVRNWLAEEDYESPYGFGEEENTPEFSSEGFDSYVFD